MGICADNAHAWSNNTLFWQDNVLNANPANLKIILDVMLLSKVPYSLCQASSLDILIWGKMVRHQSNLGIIEYWTANLLKFLNCWWSCNIISQYHIQLTGNKLSWYYRLKTSMLCQYLFGHIHTHKSTS